MKWYAIRVGRRPGVYTDWQEAKAQVDGVANAIYKSFPSEAAAQEFVNHRPAPIPEPVRVSAYFAEFYISSAYSVKTTRCAWALLCDRDLPQTGKYAGPPPEQKDRAVLCAVLRLLTRANLEPRLRNQPIALHVGHPNWAIQQALSKWIKIWSKKRWNDGNVINLDLYQTAWPILKTTNIHFIYHDPARGSVAMLEQAHQLALTTADAA